MDEAGATRELVEVDTGTAGRDLTPTPSISETKTEAEVLTEDIGFHRTRSRFLTEEAADLHQRSHSVEWRIGTAARQRSSTADLLAELGDLGFAWRDIARLVGVSVAAVQKWRKGDGATGESRRKVASLLAACDLIAEHYAVQEIGSWFETPLVADAPITPIDLYVQNRTDLVFEHASGHVDPEQLMTAFDPEWRGRYASDFEVFRAADGDLSIRPKG